MLKLKKMSLEEFSDYMKYAVKSYAVEKQKGEGLDEEDALKVANDSYSRLLPEGLNTPDNFLFSVVDKSLSQPIGVLWFAKKFNVEKPYAFIYDIEIVSEKRGRGLGKELLSLAEEEARKLGCTSIGLHVFGHNSTAIALYEKAGFSTTSRMMKKDFI